MSFYTRTAFRFFGRYSGTISLFFPDLKVNLKKARIKSSAEEYISTSALSTLLVFILEVPLLSFAYGFIFHDFLFSLLTGFTTSIVLSFLIFFLFTQYPKTVINERSKKLESSLPFAALYLSTIAGTKLPINKVLKMFSKFSKYGEITEEINLIDKDIDVFGFDTNTALERAVERTPSKKFKELLWGILSTSSSGGDIAAYLREKSESLMEDYRRSLSEFAKKMMLICEIYMTSIVLGTIFLIILTSIFAGMGGGASQNVILLQTLMIFIFLPLVSVAFIVMIKSSAPGEE